MKIASFDNFLKEASTQPSKEAQKLGLQYKGGGYYADPRSGKITHKTEGNRLNPYSQQPTQLEPDSVNLPDSLKNKQGMQQQDPSAVTPPGSVVQGAPNPGEEQHPHGANWNPGPDGDNCVNDQTPPDDLSYDTFVGKTNYYKWTAGKDGSNYTNIQAKDLLDEPVIRREYKNWSYNNFLKEGPMAPTEQGNPTSAATGITPTEKAQQLGLISDGHGSYRDQSGRVVARTVNGELVFYDQAPGGGAVSDSGGGGDLVSAEPTWSDPITGMAITPPSKPETPEEIAAVPPATPAQAPAGYNRFMQKRKEDMYKDQALQDQANTQIEQQFQPVEKMLMLYPDLKLELGAMDAKLQKTNDQIAEAQSEEEANELTQDAAYLSHTINSFKDNMVEILQKHKHMPDMFIDKMLPLEMLNKGFEYTMSDWESRKAQVEEALAQGEIDDKQYRRQMLMMTKEARQIADQHQTKEYTRMLMKSEKLNTEKGMA